MGLRAEQGHLTTLDARFEKQRKATVPGMAHFAKSGPAGKTCRECFHWDGCGEGDGYHSINGRYRGALKPRACNKYRELMGATGNAIPHQTAACKYFEVNDDPPVVARKE